MSSRDRDSKSLHDKLKVFFKKGASAPLPARNELVVTPELERELGADSPLHRRLRTLKEVGEKALHIRIQDVGIKKLWTCIRDLLDDQNTEARHLALWFLRCLAEGQPELELMRTMFFRYLRTTHPTRHPDDEQLRFKLLHTMTNTGKNITCFEEQIGSFLLEWLPQIQPPAHTVEFLQLIINVVKFNATYLDEPIVHGIVNNACHLCVYSTEPSVVQSSLSLLEAVLAYSLLPRAALRTFVCALCRTVNIDQYCQNSWKLMRCVVAADIGYATLLEMVSILREGGESGADADAGAEAGAGGEAVDAGLVRGAVFYINMALWGPRRVPTLKLSFLAVLPAFLRALDCHHAVVTYEVVVAVASLVARVPHLLHEPAWHVLIQILKKILEHDKSLNPPNELIHSRLHGLITSIEQLQDAGQYLGDADALLDLIDMCGHDRPEASTMRLITYRAEALSPTGPNWVSSALTLAERYLKHESRLPVRLHALNAIISFVKRNREVYGCELVERVGVPVLGACALDAAAPLRAAAARALTDLAKLCVSDACTDLIDLLEKILNRPFEMFVTDVPIPAESDASDLRLAAGGLLELVHHKLLGSPAAHPARCFLVLLDHLDHHYRRPPLFQHHPDIRIKIFDMIFGLRANAFNCVGFCYDANGVAVYDAAAVRLRPVCSPFLLAEPPVQRGQMHQTTQAKDPPPGSCMIPVGRCARALTDALSREKEWGVLQHVVRALPHLLQARAPAVARRAQDLDVLAATLCSLVSDRSLYFPECLRAGAGAGGRPSVSEFHGAVLPALAALAPYHTFLEPQTQQRIVRCLLKYGMVLRTPQPYINALTMFTLETRETMVKMLPEVLLDLSKISDTKAIASPMLEFLSTLTRLPKVFASFVEDQYMSVFAILLPYTNPSRYNHYVVSLAHHVIAAWFLKCRLSYRKNFVRFIINGLHNYIIMPFEEQLQYKSHHFQQNANEDSSNRQRSSSLGSKAVSRAPIGGRGGACAPAAFHVELTETCVDLLARYTSTPCSVKPHRSDTADFLFNGGQSMTWLVGHKLVTITTSGCLQNSIKQGLCERCAVLCKLHTDSVSSPLPPLPQSEPLADALSEHNNEQPDRHDNTNTITAPQVQVNDGAQLSADSAPAQAAANNNAHEVKRQNSSENNKPTDPVVDALNHFSQRFERISKEVDTDESSWSRVGELVSAGACPCWCANWAEVHVRSPTGDVSWVMRMQNQMSWDYLVESPLQDVAALLSPLPASASASAAAASGPVSSASSGLGDSRQDVTSEGEIRSRSGSSSSHSRPATAPAQDLHKSSSDSVVSGDRRSVSSAHTAASVTAHPLQPLHPLHPLQPHPLRMSTQPINIPSSPQRQSSSSTTDDDDMLLILPEGKCRQPVRRSNSSPEMSSSWKLPPPHDTLAHHADPDDMILLPSCEPTNPSGAGAGAGAGAASLHLTKKASKKSDMRVSCEAIPEEMCSTSPLAQLTHAHAHTHTHTHTHTHPHLMTYNSDPGEMDQGGKEGGEKCVSVSESAEACAHNGDLPATPQPHHHQLQKTASDSVVTESRKPPTAPRASSGGLGPATEKASSGVGTSATEREDLPPLARSKRSNTISVMSPTRRHRENSAARTAMSGSVGASGATAAAAAAAAGGAGAGGGAGAVGGGGGGVTPAFVFLQLYHNMSTYPTTPPVPGEAASVLNPLAARPLRVAGAQHERTIKNLDLLPPLETYKIGVLYVGPGQQDNEVLILKNEYGSVRYSEFVRQLGTLVPLDGVGAAASEPHLFVNLEKGGKDGAYTYVWHDDIMQVLFHVATAMPSLHTDPTCNEKRKYIGNDYVSIVYNDSGHDFNIHTIKGQLNFCIVVVEPFEHSMNRVLIKTKDERIRGKFLAHLETQCVSDHNVALLARQLALHCALASHISQSLKLGGAAYASNSLERLRAIKRLRRRVEAERVAAAARASQPYADAHAPDLAMRVAIDDFNDYT